MSHCSSTAVSLLHSIESALTHHVPIMAIISCVQVHLEARHMDASYNPALMSAYSLLSQL